MGRHGGWLRSRQRWTSGPLNAADHALAYPAGDAPHIAGMTRPACTRRQLLWFSTAAASIAVAAEWQKPDPIHWKMPECDLPAAPKIVYRAGGSVTIEA